MKPRALRRRMNQSRQLLNHRKAPVEVMRAPTEAELEARRRTAEMERALAADDFEGLLRAARPSGVEDE